MKKPDIKEIIIKCAKSSFVVASHDICVFDVDGIMHPNVVNINLEFTATNKHVVNATITFIQHVTKRGPRDTPTKFAVDYHTFSYDNLILITVPDDS